MLKYRPGEIKLITQLCYSALQLRSILQGHRVL